ncbi:unnamed protein product [Hermetia illucens]|uniref:protein-tyrosine-phosphatase n=1 Tax=Hermetia illucens TaxID=343691 RepID=A0A7R8UYM2_HERIL|nr:phosphatidylinositol phosphatase PTPRQ isoform X2 [Hermetia illucens]CAD7089422.1 unnamed protein product [Hermetia illucens]
MDVWIKQWKCNMIQNLFLICYFLVIVNISSHVCFSEEGAEDNITLNFTSYPTYIEFETEYEDYNLTEVTCNLPTIESRMLRESLYCKDLQPCTTYSVTAKVKFLDESISNHFQYATTTYEAPTFEYNPIPFFDSIYLIWNITSRNCVKEIKVEVVGDGGFKETSRNPGYTEDLTVDNLLPCSIYNVTMSLTDINGQVLGNKSESVATENVDTGPAKSVECNVTENSVLITWEEPKYPTCVEVYYLFLMTEDCYSTNADLCTTIYNVSSTRPRQLTIDNLEGCENYVLKISVNGDHSNSSSIHEFSTEILDPGPVVDFRESSLLSTNVTLVWSPPKDNHLCVKHYIIGMVDSDESFNVTEETFTFENLLPCARYEIEIAAVSLNDVIGEWTRRNVTMPYDRPSGIRDENVKAYPKEMGIEWAEPDFANLCVVNYKVLIQNEEISYKFETVVKDRSLYIDGLYSCMTYTVSITPVTLNKESPDGETVVFSATTGATVVDTKDAEFDPKVYNRSISIRFVNKDEKNNCQMLFVQFTCDSDTDAPIRHAEVTLPVTQGSHMPFTGVLEPLSPATQYICKVSVYNIDGWSASKAGSLLTTPDYPGPPQNITLRSLSSTAFNIKWQAPRYRNGNLALYRLYIQTIGPKYKIPKRCDTIKIVQLNQNVEATKTEWTFLEASPYFEYSVQVAASNEIGVGEFSNAVTIVTHSSRSDPVKQFSVGSIEGPELSETYKANVTIQWSLPCYTHGPVVAFEGAFIGERVGFDTEYIPWSLSVNSSDEDSNETFEWVQDRLKPEYNYTTSISVLVDEAVNSLESKLTFISPSGIPPKPNVSYNGDVDVFSAPNPTESAYARLSTDILNSDMGRILYISLLISEKGCQSDPSPKMALIDSEKEWPDVPSWADVQKDACIKQYQTTPKRWSPTPVNADHTRTMSIIQYVVGGEDCSSSRSQQDYCNGPLKPGVEYVLVVRLFTSSGYADGNCLYFRTDSKVEVQFVLLMIISCLLIAFFLGFLYLWITKKIVWHGEPFIGVEEHTGDITSKNFLNYYEEIVKSDKLNREFKELTAISNELNLSNVASTSNETKNRYSNIFPYDKNRVILDCDSDGADYINASFINGYKRRKEYIATQGPKPETFVDFWRMIIQYNVRLIVMVTQFREGETVKCHQYFPFINKEMRIGLNIKATCKKETHFENYVRRELLVEHSSDCVSRTVVHYLFRKWPDHDCPDDVTHLIEFVRKVKHEKIPRHSPVIVHCSAGVGRTGTFIGLDIIMQRLKSENRISIYDTVKQLRFQRMKMVQTIQQYQFLYKCAYHLVQKKYPSSSKKHQKKNGVSEAIENNYKNSILNTRNGKCINRAESIM